MLDQTELWPPRVGDRVSIRGGRLLGVVERIEEDHSAQPYTVQVFAPAEADAGTTYELTQAARVARTTYALDELEPRPESHHRT